MKVLDVFSWLPAKEISIEELEQIFIEHFNGAYILKGRNVITVVGYKE